MTSVSPHSSLKTRRFGLPFFIAKALAKFIRQLLRLTGREGGALPGKVLLTLCPTALTTLGRRSKRRGCQTILVSATNGKTTLSALLAEILSAEGLTVTHNVTGANLRSGIATTLLLSDKRCDVAVLETDEATLPSVASALDPEIILLGNLFRDQLDRHGSVESIADKWESVLEEVSNGGTSVIYAADDPLITKLVHSARSDSLQSISYGIAHQGVIAGDHAAQDGASHAYNCPWCLTPLSYNDVWVGHLGDWYCPSCERRRPGIDIEALNISLNGLAATTLTVASNSGRSDSTQRANELDIKLRIPGLYNVYNVLGAIAAAHALGVSDESIIEALSKSDPSFGRFERVPVPGGGTLTLLLVKNPTGLNEVIETLVASKVDLTATLFGLNDFSGDGRDISWVWEANLEPLLERAGVIISTGTRPEAFGLRAIYGGLTPEGVIVESDPEEALYRVLERAREFTEHGHAYALVTYTAMLKIRAAISERGWTQTYWAMEPRKKARTKR